MARKRKIEYTPQPYERKIIAGKKDKFTLVYLSMCESTAWKALVPRQQMLYLWFRFQWSTVGTKNTPSGDYPDNADFQRPYVVYMNKAVAMRTGLYTKVEGGNFNRRDFYNDVRRLENVGFIECLQKGKNTRTKSVYVLVDKWKFYEE